MEESIVSPSAHRAGDLRRSGDGRPPRVLGHFGDTDLPVRLSGRVG
jgi:hypothetical protein